jgi:hydrogenase maturation protease
MKTLIVGIGNDLLSDDAVGILAVRALRARVGPAVDVIECNSTGLALLDVLVGYDRVVIIDSIHSGRHAPGTVREMALEDLRRIPGTSPHYAGLPEVISIGRRLGLAMPRDLLIYAVEIPECLIIGGGLSDPVASILDELVAGLESAIRAWHMSAAEESPASAH